MSVRILINASGIKHGGALTILNKVLPDVVAGRTYVLVCSEDIGLTDFYKINNLKTSSIFTTFYAVLGIIFDIFRFSPDYVLSFSNVGSVFFRKKNVIYFHNSLILTSQKFRFRILKWLLVYSSRGGRVIVQTDYMQFLCLKNGIRSVDVVFPGVLLGIRPKAARERRIVFSGVSDPNKGFLDFCRLVSNVESYKSIAIGGGARSFSNIQFSRGMERDLFLDILSSSAVLVICSYEESLGLSLFEAVLLDVPVIVVNEPYLIFLVDQFPFLMKMVHIIDRGTRLSDSDIDDVCSNCRFLDDSEKYILETGDHFVL